MALNQVDKQIVATPLTTALSRHFNISRTFIFPCFRTGDRMIFAEKTRKKFSPLINVEKFNLSPGLS